MKQFLIAGNWKMNTNVFEAVELTKHILKGLTDRQIKDSVKVLICPPYTNLDSVKREISNPNLLMGAQNCHFEPKGAFTGEISIMMLKQFNCQYVIVGHSERRQYFHETNEFINAKIKALLRHSIMPILCIGETLEDRNAGSTFDVLTEQLSKSLAEISNDDIAKIVVAYEPVWAIGTGITATIEQVTEAHNFIRKFLCDNFGENANQVLIQYGGSVNAENAKEILAVENVNGALIGGAALKHEQFLQIIDFANAN